MNIPFTNKKLTWMSGCLMVIPILIIMGILTSAGTKQYGEMSPYSIALITLIILGVIVMLGKGANKKYAGDVEAFADKQKGLSDIAAKYNKEISNLESSFKSEIRALVSDKDSQLKDIRKNYQEKYWDQKKGYESECNTFLKEWEEKHGSLHLQDYWKWAICIGFVVILCASSFSFGLATPPSPSVSPMTALMDTRSWNADNIPMPHLTDGDQYVSNPDSILSQEVVDSINVILRRLDDQFGIESAMVIVGHIDNDDPVAMVRGIYKNYGVGRNDRGLVIVVGYLDHSYFIAPGRSLEGDLTDLETNHLAQDYLIPSMKAELPDSGMLYLARGTYALMSEKDMPQMTALKSNADKDDGMQGAGVFALFLALFGGWGYYGRSVSRKVGFADMKATKLRSNPFFLYFGENSGSGGGHVGGGYSGGHSRSSSRSWGGGGSSHSSGGYGGGSWGGGGSGGRW